MRDYKSRIEWRRRKLRRGLDGYRGCSDSVCDVSLALAHPVPGERDPNELYRQLVKKREDGGL